MEEQKNITYDDVVAYCQPRIYKNREGKSVGVYLPAAQLVFPKDPFKDGTRAYYTYGEAREIAENKKGKLPNLHEVHLIQLFLPQINEILKAIGGTEITTSWFWAEDTQCGMGMQWNDSLQKISSLNYKGKIFIVYKIQKS